MLNTLEADSIQLRYDNRKILQSVYLKLETGKVTGILGRNGCGKSSLLKILYGEITRCQKSVRVNRRALLSSYRDPSVMRMLPHWSFIPQDLTLARVFDDFKLNFRRFVSLFPEFENRERYKVAELSGGSVRIVEVYCMLVCCTQFTLLDEPFTHLSPRSVEVMSEVIREEKKNKGILITDHDYRTILALSDTLCLLLNGTLYPVCDEVDLVRYGYLPGRN